MADATASQAPMKWQETSQKNSPETANLANLMEWLKALMASVKVTNPIARTDPALAIQTLAERLLKYPPNVVRAELDKWPLREGAAWPTVGEMVSQIDYVIRKAKKQREQAKKSADAQKPGELSSSFQRRVLQSDLGQQALGEGWACSLLLELEKRNVEWPRDVHDLYIAKRRKAVAERRSIAAGIDESTPMGMTLGKLGRSMEDNNDDLVNLYGQN